MQLCAAWLLISMNLRTSLPLILTVLLLAKIDLQAETSLSIESGVQISWPTVSDNTYQLQWAPAQGGAWMNLGSEQSGDGSASSYYDVQAGRIYQVLETSPETPPTAPSPVNGGFESGTGGDADH